MKYFLDCEFHERKIYKTFTDKVLGRKTHTVELISIALVREDGRTYYAESKEFDMNAAKKHKFLSKNVLPNLIGEGFRKWNHEIRDEIVDFMSSDEEPELIGWWGAYDWYVFCSLFENMIDCINQTGFKYYTDLKSLLKNTSGISKKSLNELTSANADLSISHNAYQDAMWLREAYYCAIDLAKSSLKEELSSRAHDNTRSLIKHVLKKGTINENGSLTLPKKMVNSWTNRSNLSLNDLSVNQKRTPYVEGERYSSGAIVKIGKFLNEERPLHSRFIEDRFIEGNRKS